MATGHADTAQSFALRLKRAIAGYGTKLDPSTDIVVMGIDSATPGRMGITFYRELKGSEFLNRIEAWHANSAWPQYFGKDRKFIGAPAPRDIAEAAYGRRLDDKLSKATVERLLPCIIDGSQLPWISLRRQHDVPAIGLVSKSIGNGKSAWVSHVRFSGGITNKGITKWH